MSAKGIEKAASVFEVMQRARRELFAMATQGAKIDHQDLKLAHMLERGKDAMTTTFAKVTVE